ncbi:MAG: M24 family metallopeptidase [Candidatus Helarchaeota archaeon]
MLKHPEIKNFSYDKNKTAELMKKYDLDVLVLSTPENVFYTSGMPVRQAAKNPILFVLANQYPTIVVIDREGEENLILWDLYQTRSWIKNVKGASSVKRAVKNMTKIVKKSAGDAAKIGVESRMPLYQFIALKKAFPEAQIEPEKADQLLLDLRLIKSNEEIRRITESTRISEKTIEALINNTKPGVKDLDLITIARRTMIDEGADGVDHLTMSINASDPEHPGIGITLKDGDITRYDMGAIYQGYGSDVSRHAFIGKPPKEVQDLVRAVVAVQNACEKTIKPGISTKEIYQVAQNTWKEIDRTDPLILTAHSVGIQIEEFHFFDPTTQKATKRNFEKNMTLDLEAWALIPKLGLVGNEDTYQVTSSGCKRLTTLPMKVFEV